MDLKTILINYGFIDNEYLERYYKIINNNKNMDREKFKTERHHFIPVCYYNYIYSVKTRKDAERFSKLDFNNFIVNLSHFEHLLAHYYLCFCANDNIKDKLIYSFSQMTYCNIDLLNSSEKQIILELENISILRQRMAELVSINQKGVPMSEVHKKKLSLLMKGKNTGPKSDKHKKSLSEAARHRKFNSTKGRISIYNPLLNKKKYIKEEDFYMYENDGWIKGGIPHTEEEKYKIGQNSKKCLTGRKRDESANLKTKETMIKLAQDKNSSYYKSRKDLAEKLKGKKRPKEVVEKIVNSRKNNKLKIESEGDINDR